MLKRIVLLCLGLWLITASGLAAHAGPCDMQRLAAADPVHVHCDGMPVAPDTPDEPDAGTPCCCPAVLTAIASVDAPETTPPEFRAVPGFPPDAIAASRHLAPEPHPPKA